MGALADCLEHSGVKGMKWGSRKAKKSSSKPKTSRSQKEVNFLNKLASGKGSNLDKYLLLSDRQGTGLYVIQARKKYKDVPLSQGVAKAKLDYYKKLSQKQKNEQFGSLFGSKVMGTDFRNVKF